MLLAVVVVLGACALGVVAAETLGGDAPSPSSVSPVGAGPVGGHSATDSDGDARTPRSTRERLRGLREARAVLRRWDQRRADAYATGSVVALRRLYVTGSGAGRRDADLLRAYLGRGYRVTGMRTQVLGLRVVDVGPDRRVLRVTDRLQAAVAVGRGRRLRLPADAASTRVVTLVRGTTQWRVAAVTDAS